MRKGVWGRRALTSLIAGSCALSLLGFSGTVPAGSVQAAESSNAYGLQDDVQDGLILHAWDWSFDNITAQMENIAEAGYSAVQTSPIQPYKQASDEGNSTNTTWWLFYQPLDFTITQSSEENLLGSEEEFKTMCETADQYGIKVIVDVVANHVAATRTGEAGFDEDVAERLQGDDFYHDLSFPAIDYSDRDSIINDSMGSAPNTLPDLNTENDTLQGYVIDFLEDCIDDGADGFRFDAAKHIGVPADGAEYDFWPNVIETVKAYYEDQADTTADELYCYGEILGQPGGSTEVSDYTSYLHVTDDTTSSTILNGVKSGSASTAATYQYQKGVSGTNLVLWAESHDTYQNSGGSTTDVSQQDINKAWAIVAARSRSTGLYYVRTDGFQAGNIGDIGTYYWESPEVTAVNQFHNAFAGLDEALSSDGNIAIVERGTSGVVLVNCGTGNTTADVSVPVSQMNDGTYTDQITGSTFTVEDGTLTGSIGDTGIAVVYDPDNITGEKQEDTGDDVARSADELSEGTVIYFENTEEWETPYAYMWNDAGGTVGSWPGVEMTKVEDATDDHASIWAVKFDGSYSHIIFSNEGKPQTADLNCYNDMNLYHYDTGEWEWFDYDETTIDFPEEEENEEETEEETEKTGNITLFFDNTEGWDTVYAYAWNDSGNNGSWPGTEMTAVDGEDDIYTITIPAKYTSIIFNNGSGTQTADLTIPDEGNLYSYADGTWSTHSVALTGVVLDSSSLSVQVGAAAALTATKDPANADADTTFTWSSSDTSIATVDANGKVTGVSEGTATITVTTAEGYAATCAVTVVPEETRTIYFENTEGWDTVYAHMWNDDGATTTWPGTEMTQVDGSDTLWEVEVADKYTSIIFNNGSGTQTGNLSLNDSYDLYTYSSGEWSSYEAEDSSDTSSTDEDTEEETRTIYFKNTDGWTNVYAHMWNDAGATTVWPGDEMSLVDGTDDVYSIEVSSEYTSIIFNNGSGTQTDNLSLDDSCNLYTYSSGEWSSYEAEDSSDTSSTDEDTEEETRTIYFKNTDGWTNVYAHMWNDAGATTTWPGNEMSPVDGTDDVYSIEVSTEYTSIIFNNGSGTQTDNLTLGDTNNLYTYSSGEWSVYGEEDSSDTSSTDEEPEEETRTIYFKNTDGWTNVYAHMWNDAGATTVWPGDEMSLVDGTDDVYSIEVSSEYTSIIFNNGSGTQTGNLTLDDTNNLYSYDSGAWSVYGEEDSSDTSSTDENTEEETRTIYFKNTDGWASVYAHMWNSEGATTTWPGKEMSPVDGTDDVYSIEVSSEYTNIIFNNNDGTQTADLTLDGSSDLYTYSTGAWTTYTADSEDTDEDGTGEETKTYTVSLENGDGYTVKSSDAASVEEGGSFTFTVEIADGYHQGDDFAVLVNGTALDNTDGSYTIADVSQDLTITVTGVEKDEESNESSGEETTEDTADESSTEETSDDETTESSTEETSDEETTEASTEESSEEETTEASTEESSSEETTEDAKTSYKYDVNAVMDGVLTDGMRQKGYSSADDILEALEEAASTAVGTFTDDTKYSFIDITFDDTIAESVWNDGIQIILPFPDGTDGDGYEFDVRHMKDDGSIERLGVDEVTDDGILVTLHSASPILVSAKKTSSSSAAGEHVHHMAWVVTKKATETTDGEKSYMCTECGYVEYVAKISAFEVWNDDLVDIIHYAREGQNVQVDATRKGWTSMSPEVFRALEKRTDVKLTVTWKGADGTYVTVIDGSKLDVLDDIDTRESDDCYGFLYLQQYFETTKK